MLQVILRHHSFYPVLVAQQTTKKKVALLNEYCVLAVALETASEGLVGHRWEAGDVHEWSAITYPDKLHQYATDEFQKIKKRQADLLGIKDGIRSKL